MFVNFFFIIEELVKQFKLVDIKWILIVLQFVYWVREVVQEIGKDNVFVVGEVDGYQLILEFFKDDGLSVLEFFIDLKEDIVVIFFLSGMIGYFKGVMFIYCNFVVCGFMM